MKKRFTYKGWATVNDKGNPCYFDMRDFKTWLSVACMVARTKGAALDIGGDHEKAVRVRMTVEVLA